MTTNTTENGNSVIPLESNPFVFSEFAKKLGLTPILSFTDIYSLSDPDLLAFLPRPIQAVILLFPVSEGYEKLMKKEEALRTSALLHVNTTQDSELPSGFQPKTYQTENNIFWLKQTIKNACGLYALLHVLMNLPNGLIVKDSVVSKLKGSLLNSSDADAAKLIKEIGSSMHGEYAQQGQTEAPELGDEVDLHFLCFMKTDLGIVELDGRRNGPVVLQSGAVDEGEDIINSTVVIQRIEKYMSLVEGENALKFAMMGLAPNLE